MKLEDQVCSLDLAKRLEELGVKQKSLFCYPICHSVVGMTDGRYNKKNDFVCGLTFNPQQRKDIMVDMFDYYSAFTVAELGLSLPHGYHTFFSDGDGLNCWCCVKFSEPEFDCSYEHWISADTEANARAKMLIYLLENKLI